MQHAESEHIFLGFRQDPGPRFGEPLLVPRSGANEHVYIAGQTGSAKTVLGITPLVIQLVTPYVAPVRDARGRIMTDASGVPVFRREPEPRPPVVIFDMKGDPALFNTARTLAAAHGYPFRFFTLDRDRASHYFDPFQNLGPKPAIELAELYVQALSLFHGEDYGASYFSRQNRRALLTVLDDAEKANLRIQSWEELYQRARLLKGKSFRDATELLAVLHAMTFYPQMNALGRSAKADDVIHMPTVLKERQIAYFWLPSGATSLATREIAKLGIYSLYNAAQALTHAGHRRQAYVVIDELHRVAGENLSPMLTMSRGFGLSFIMASQDPKELELRTFDLRSSVMTNTRLKQFFTVTDPDQMRELLALSGEQIAKQVSESEGAQYDRWGRLTGRSYSRTARDERVARLDRDVFRRVTDDPTGSLVVLSRGGGYAELSGIPVWVKGAWPMSFAEYQRRSDFTQMPWPTVQAAPKAVVAAATDRQREGRQAEYDANVALMQDLLRELAGRTSKAAEAPSAEPPPPKKKRKPSDSRRAEARRAKKKAEDVGGPKKP